MKRDRATSDHTRRLEKLSGVCDLIANTRLKRCTGSGAVSLSQAHPTFPHSKTMKMFSKKPPSGDASFLRLDGENDPGAVPGLESHPSEDNVRIQKFLSKMPVSPELAQMAEKAKPVVVAMVRCFMAIVPLYKKVFDHGYKVYTQLPTNAIQMVFGAALCFFGGTYVASIAAIEAFRQLGWNKVKEQLLIVQEQVCAWSRATRQRRILLVGPPLGVPRACSL